MFVAATHLTQIATVDQVRRRAVTYIHLLFDRHEVILANGAWSESFQPGDFSLGGLGNAQRQEIYDLFPELKTPGGLDTYAAARRTLKKHEAMLLTRWHLPPAAGQPPENMAPAP